MDAQALHAIICERDGLDILSRERVRAELLKLVVTKRAAEVVTVMSDVGLLQPILAGIAYPARLARVASIETYHEQLPDAELRWIALFVQVMEDAERLRERLRLSNAESYRAGEAARALACLHGRVTPPAPSELRIFLFQFGPRAARDALLLAHAESRAAAGDPVWSSAHAFLRDTPVPTLPFRGSDLIARGIPAGQAIGTTLKTLQALWIRAGFPKEPAVLARLLEEAMNTSK
jgi:poly(A) polymerase